MKSYKKYLAILASALGIFLLFYFTFSNLTETPPTWMDEGIIIQTARNFSISGFSGLRIDPQTIISSGYVTTSYPATLPIAISFSLFGENLLNARIVMAGFIVLLVCSMMFWLKKNLLHENLSENSLRNNPSGIIILILSLFLIVTFPPLYGHGKNVLGEIPGLFFLFSSMIFLKYAYDAYWNPAASFKKRLLLTAATGIFIGLTIATKPIFILLLPALVVVAIINFKLIRSIHFNKKTLLIILAAVFSFILPLIFWTFFQFHGETVKEMFSIYANPHSTVVEKVIVTNLTRFVTEGQPIYTALLMLVWTVILAIRFKRKETIHIGEWILWSFAIIVLCAYMRTIGYYRYFFLAQFVALVMLPGNLFYLARGRLMKAVAISLCCILTATQIYGLTRTSWIALHGKSTQTADLEAFFKDSKADKEILVYQAPELVTFIPHENYSQFMDITETIRVGSTSLDRIVKGLPSLIATNPDYTDKIIKMSNNKYILHKTVGKYQFLQKAVKK